MQLTRKLSKKAQQHLLSDLYRLAKAGIKQREVAEQLVLFGNKTHRKIGKQVIKSLENGDNFSAGLKPWITSIAWEALVANEATGEWSQGLAHAKQAVTTQSAATVQLVKALLFPLLGLLILIAMAGLNATQFLPLLHNIVPQKLWGALTIASLNVGEFSNVWGMNLGLTFFGLLVICIVTLPWFSGSIRIMVDNWPLYRQYRLLQVSSLLRSMSHLNLAGFGLQDTLTYLSLNTTPYLRAHMKIMQAHIKKGETNIGRIMDTGILNESEKYSMLILGEIGGTGDTLANCADIHQELLMAEIEMIKSWGANTIKIIAALIGGLIAGGIGQVLILIPSAIRV